MAIGVADHKWTLQELLTFRVPPTDNSILTFRSNFRRAGELTAYYQ
jgi:hypothetical protein